jgi:hypothetical protein
MKWTTPSLEEIKMDAEIGSYQPDDEPSFVATRSDAARGLAHRSPTAGVSGPDDPGASWRGALAPVM